MKIGKIKNLSMQQQVQVNSENIEELAKVIKNVYNTQKTLTTASTTIDVSDIVDWDTNTETGLILSKDGLLFDIVAVVDSTVYIKYWANIKGPQGNTGSTGATGQTGNGIASITKTDTTGLVDTYTVLFTNGNTTTFTVTNGANGTNGQDGATGNGIASVSKTATVGLVDTYTITFTNGQTTTFDVTNGANGTNGTNGTNGQDGADFTALTYKGLWVSGTDYNKFDLVYIESSSVRTFYVALNDVQSSAVTPDLDTTNFKEMFEIPVSSSAVQSQRVYGYSDIKTLIDNGKQILGLKLENVEYNQLTLNNSYYTINLDVANSSISNITKTSSINYLQKIMITNKFAYNVSNESMVFEFSSPLYLFLNNTDISISRLSQTNIDYTNDTITLYRSNSNDIKLKVTNIPQTVYLTVYYI